MKNVYVGILNTTPSLKHSTHAQILSEHKELITAAQIHYGADCVHLMGVRIIVENPTMHINELAPLNHTWVNELIDPDPPEIPEIIHVWMKRHGKFYTYDGQQKQVLPELQEGVLYVTNTNSYINSGKHTIQIDSFLEMIYPWYGRFTGSQLDRIHRDQQLSRVVNEHKASSMPIDDVLRIMHSFAVQQIAPVLSEIFRTISPDGRRGYPHQFLTHDKITPYLLIGRTGVPLIQTHPSAFYWYPGNCERPPRILQNINNFAIYSLYDVLAELYLESSSSTAVWMNFRASENTLEYAFRNDLCTDPDYTSTLMYVGYGCVIVAGGFRVKRGDQMYMTNIMPIMTATTIMLCPGYRGFWAIDDNQSHNAEVLARGPIGDFAYYMDYQTLKRTMHEGANAEPTLYNITVTHENIKFMGNNRDGNAPRVGDIVQRYWSMDGFVAELSTEPYRSIPTLP